MTDTLALGIIAALGPIVTIAITKLIDYKFITKTHSLSYKKEYFLKQLNAFEKAASYYNIAQLTISNMVMIMKVLFKEEVHFSDEDATKMMAELQKQISTVHEKTQDVALAIGIYQDVDFSDQDEIFATQFITKVGELNSLGFDLKIHSDFLNSAPVEREVEIEDKMKSIIGEMRTKVNELQGVVDLVKPKYKNSIKTLRNKLKKYEE